jgi:hypothetical protein
MPGLILFKLRKNYSLPLRSCVLFYFYFLLYLKCLKIDNVPHKSFIIIIICNVAILFIDYVFFDGLEYTCGSRDFLACEKSKMPLFSKKKSVGHPN